MLFCAVLATDTTGGTGSLTMQADATSTTSVVSHKGRKSVVPEGKGADDYRFTVSVRVTRQTWVLPEINAQVVLYVPGVFGAIISTPSLIFPPRPTLLPIWKESPLVCIFVPPI